MEPSPLVGAMALAAQQRGSGAAHLLPLPAPEGAGAQEGPAEEAGSKRPRTDNDNEPNLRANEPAPAANAPQGEDTAARQLCWFNIRPDKEHASFSAEKLVTLTGQDILATMILRMTELQTELDSEFPMRFEQSSLNTDTIKIGGEEKTYFHVQASFLSKAHVNMLVKSGPSTVHPPLGEDDDGVIYNIVNAQPLKRKVRRFPPFPAQDRTFVCLCPHP